MKELFKRILKSLEAWWKSYNADYKIEIKSIKLVSPWVLIIDFNADGQSHYVILENDYREIRTKYLKRNNNVEPISFEEFMDEISLLIPAEDVVKHYIKNWRKKC